jgi:hypothetical protein
MLGKFLGEKMFCWLTLWAALILLGAGVGAAQERPAIGKFSVRWQNLPLGEAVARLRQVTGTAIFIDRRVDPDQRVTFSASNASVENVLSNLASSTRLGHARLGRLYYLGPQVTADGLAALAAKRRNEIATLAPPLKNSLLGRRRLIWPRLTEPRGLTVQLAEQHGWRIDNAAAIPHDLWAAGELPSMPLADQLSVLLAGFDVTYRVDAATKTIEIKPATWPKHSPKALARRPDKTSPTRGKAPSKQVFTLRVENQPVGRVLEQLATRLNWKLDVDANAIRAAGLSLDTLVSFDVQNANETQLLDALLAPAGLAATSVGDRLRIAPK